MYVKRQTICSLQDPSNQTRLIHHGLKLQNFKKATLNQLLGLFLGQPRYFWQRLQASKYRRAIRQL